MSWQQPPAGYYPDQDPNSKLAGGARPIPPGEYPAQAPYNPAYPPAQPAAYPPAQPAAYPSYPAYPAYPAPGQPAAVPPPYGAPAPPYGPGPIPPQNNMYGTGGYPDAENPMNDGTFGTFDDQNIRRGFIRKVYGILMCQLLVTTGIIALFTYHQPTKELGRKQAVFYSSFGVMLVCIICMACCASVRRKAPMNFIFLGIFTVAESFMLGCISAFSRSEDVVMAVGITAVVCFALTLFALQTKWDFTVLGGALFVGVIVLFVFGIVAAFFPGKTVHLVYASCGALLFSVYLVYDTQLMMGGKHKYSISPEEYIFAALNLYLDIINIFIYILSIISASRD